MFTSNTNMSATSTTNPKVVLPFYLYAGIFFLISCILLFLNSAGLLQHYFQPKTLAIVHSMALGWGTMMILGASHQLIPVLVESKLYSESLAKLSFYLAAAGIPLLVYGFYIFDVGPVTQAGALAIIAAIICYLINCAASMLNSKQENVHAFFIFTATLWLLATVIVGYLLLLNFTTTIFTQSSLHYLSLHAHMGFAGWFVLLVIGVGSRLLPMFLISKYQNPKLLWVIYFLLNTALVSFLFIFLYSSNNLLFYVPVLLFLGGLILFGRFCFLAYKNRIRKKVDEQMKISLLSVGLLFLPVIILIVILLFFIFSESAEMNLVIAYGFTLFFGWLTAIILGMTFKTLPFIIWNKKYAALAGKTKTPSPKDLFSEKVFNIMNLCYLAGFIIFCMGIFLNLVWLRYTGSALLVLTAALYNYNILKLVFHKPIVS